MSSTSARPLLCVVSVLFSLRTRTLLSHASLRTRVCDRQAGWHDMDASACPTKGCNLCSGWSPWGEASNVGCYLAIDESDSGSWRPYFNTTALGNLQDLSTCTRYPQGAFWLAINFSSPVHVGCVTGFNAGQGSTSAFGGCNWNGGLDLWSSDNGTAWTLRSATPASDTALLPSGM